MPIYTTFLLSLGAMVCWGVLYIFTTKLTRSVGPLWTLVLFQSVSIVMHILLLPFLHPSTSQQGIVSFVTLGLWSGFTWLLFLYATKIGNVAIVMPVSDISIPLIAFLGILFLHESFSFFKAVSILLVLIGVVTLALDFKAIKALKKQFVFTGVVPALLAGCATSLYVFINTYFVRWYGWFGSSFFIRVGVVIFALSLIMFKRIPIKLKHIPWKYVLGAAFVDTIGFILYNIALTGSELSYVSVIANSSLFVTVILSAWLLKEKLNKVQWLGFACVMAGILLLQLH